MKLASGFCIPELLPEENSVFRFILFHRWSKGNFLFLRVLRSMGRQCATPCFLTLAHDPFLPAVKRVRFGNYVPPHAPLASPIWDPGSSVRMPRNATPSVPSNPTPFRCTTTGTSIVPLCDHRDLVLWHLSQWGLRVNWEKSKVSPVQIISFLGVELDGEYDGTPLLTSVPK